MVQTSSWRSVEECFKVVPWVWPFSFWSSTLARSGKSSVSSMSRERRPYLEVIYVPSWNFQLKPGTLKFMLNASIDCATPGVTTASLTSLWPLWIQILKFTVIYQAGKPQEMSLSSIQWRKSSLNIQPQWTALRSAPLVSSQKATDQHCPLCTHSWGKTWRSQLSWATWMH